MFQITVNKIGDEGWKAIAEALKKNKAITELDLSIIYHHKPCFTFTF